MENERSNEGIRPVDVPNPAHDSILAAVIRTVTPMLVGWIMTGLLWVLTPLGVALPEGSREWLMSSVSTALAAIYYIIARKLEIGGSRIPWLGSTSQPTYN